MEFIKYKNGKFLTKIQLYLFLFKPLCFKFHRKGKKYLLTGNIVSLSFGATNNFRIVPKSLIRCEDKPEMRKNIKKKEGKKKRR